MKIFGRCKPSFIVPDCAAVEGKALEAEKPGSSMGGQEQQYQNASKLGHTSFLTSLDLMIWLDYLAICMA